ncbi:calcium-binding protein, partial [Agrobacterium vitis]|uniref:calcium-binding protein n=1 Tax=Agrobacterium vitis TaxID=373 RepID=UPI001DB6D332
VTISEAAGAGNDTVQTSVNYTLSDYVETLEYTGTGDFTGTGSAQANTIIGGSGDDTLIGGAGADVLKGGEGSDTASYAGGAAVNVNLKTNVATSNDAAGDTFYSIENLTGSSWDDTFTSDGIANILNGSGGTDTVSYGSSKEAVQINLVTKVFTGDDAAGDTLISIEKIAGSDFNDTFTANSTITFAGGKGDDTYIVGSAGVTISEAAGAGNDTVQTSVNYTLSDYVETLEYTGTGDFTGTGSAQANTIIGGSGDDTLIGGAGADVLKGGEGSDTASYAGGAAVNVNLKTNVATSNDAAGDTFYSIENLTGSSWDDTFTSDGIANILNGSGGTDTVSYGSSKEAVQINLVTKVFTGDDAAGDTLISIEKIA